MSDFVSNESSLLQTFSIRTFPWFGEEHVLNLEVSSIHQLRCGDLRNAIAEKLGLKTGSERIFGLFTLIPSPFIIPKKLCFDSDPVLSCTGNNEEFGFLRLSFSKTEEKCILSKDRIAMNLIYWEAINFHEVGGILGDSEERFLELILKSLKIKGQPGLDLIGNRVFVPANESRVMHPFRERSSSDYIKLAADARSSEALVSRISSVEKKMFLNAMLRSTHYYWQYFYKVLDCTLCGEYAFLLSTCVGLNEEFLADIVMNSAYLSLLAYSSNSEYRQLLCIPWCNIRCVTKNDTRKIFSFQMLHEDRDGYVSYISISTHSRQYDYIYTMSIYFLKRQCDDLKEYDFTKRQIENYMKFLSIALPSGYFSIPMECSTTMIIPPLPVNIQVSDQCYVNSSFIPAILDAQNAYINSALQQKYKQPSISNSASLQQCTLEQVQQVKDREEYETCAENNKNQDFGIKALKPPLPYEIIDNRKFQSRAFSEQHLANRKCTNSEASNYRHTVNEIVIFTFGNLIPLKITGLNRMTTIKELKKEVGRKLKLIPNSLDIFGLFTCSNIAFEEPIQLCSETSELPLDALCFRRLSFHKGLEKIVYKRDYAALKLLFCEAKYMLDKELFYPSLSQEKVNFLKSLANIADLQTSHHYCSRKEMEIFMEELNVVAPKCWWEYYYKVTVIGCNISEWLDSCEIHLTNVAMSIDGLSLTNSTASSAVQIPWHRVSSLLMQDSAGSTLPEQLKLEIINEIVDEKGKVIDKFLTALPIDTINIRYFFSVACHALHLYCQKKRNDSLMGRQRVSCSKFHNSTFRGPGYVFYFPDPVLQHINKVFKGPLV